mmetsp:Transcript_12422/g.26846  ORF Transcript_12422/g.26846 Transcript_12422/m.26846 type:complete len:527 (-) Transcript_12422:114-1694(-)
MMGAAMSTISCSFSNSKSKMKSGSLSSATTEPSSKANESEATSLSNTKNGHNPSPEYKKQKSLVVGDIDVDVDDITAIASTTGGCCSRLLAHPGVAPSKNNSSTSFASSAGNSFDDEVDLHADRTADRGFFETEDDDDESVVIHEDPIVVSRSSSAFGHVGDGRRLGAQPRTLVNTTFCPPSKDKTVLKEMPIQMLTHHHGADRSNIKRLSREVRGLFDDKENLPPSSAVGGGHLRKPLTRSKARKQQQAQNQHLLQEHPSVRNIKSSSSPRKGLGLGSLSRAAQQATSPASASAVTATNSTHSTLFINGYKVTMIDQERKVFVIDLVSPEQCDEIRRMTDDYVRSSNESNPKKETWRTLYTYTKMDLPCGEVTGLMEDVVNDVMRNVITVVGKVYGKEQECAKLRPRSWKEPHLLLYQVLQGKPEHTHIPMHYDGCDITWSLMLSKPSEYEGGGTYIRSLRKTMMLTQGQVLIHPGELYHRGNPIVYGTRSMIVCFLDGFDPKIIDQSRAAEDKEEYAENRLYCY